MSDLKIAVPGQVFQPELTTTQIAITNAANALSYSQVAATNIATLTFTNPHALTMQPAAATTLPNYFFTFNAATVTGGVGTLNGPIFRILSIPSTTTLTFYSTVTSATFAGASVYPIFIPVFTTFTGSQFSQVYNSYAPTPAAVVQVAYMLQGTANANITTGANCLVNYYPDNTSIIWDSTSGATPAVAPTARTLLPVSSQGQVWFDGTGSTAIVASGTAGTTRVSVIE
jgi:hypothetical protein